MSKDRLALYLQDAHSLQEGIELAKYAEEKGFEAVWQAESRLVRDCIVPMAAFAAHTTTLKVASGVTNNWTRNIGLLAATFLTLDDLAEDRIICGIGAWWDPLASKVGIKRRKPLRAMRETVEVLHVADDRAYVRGAFKSGDNVVITGVVGSVDLRQIGHGQIGQIKLFGRLFPDLCPFQSNKGRTEPVQAREIFVAG